MGSVRTLTLVTMETAYKKVSLCRGKHRGLDKTETIFMSLSPLPISLSVFCEDSDVLGEILELASYLLLLRISLGLLSYSFLLSMTTHEWCCRRGQSADCSATCHFPFTFSKTPKCSSSLLVLTITDSKPRPHTECASNATTRRAVNVCSVYRPR